jgi:hypothetical protein
VQIRSTASDALSLLGGVSAAGIIESANSVRVTTTNPLMYLIESDAATDTKRWRINVDGGVFSVMVENDAATPDTAFQVTRSTGTAGQVRFKDGTAGAPALAFINDSDTGFFSAGAGNLGFATNGVGGIVFNGSNIFGGHSVGLLEGAFGTGGVFGAGISLGRNTSGNGAPGYVTFGARTASTGYVVWADSTGVLRIGSSIPTETSGDTGGTVVGTQTSTAESKFLGLPVADTAWAMGQIRQTPVYPFTYRNGAYQGQQFFGIVTDESPLFGMDRGRSFNPLTAFGVTVLALQDLDARLRALESR